MNPAHGGGAQDATTVPALLKLAVEAVDGRRRHLLEFQVAEGGHEVAAHMHLVRGVGRRPDRPPYGGEPRLSQEVGDGDSGPVCVRHGGLLLLAAASPLGT